MSEARYEVPSFNSVSDMRDALEAKRAFIKTPGLAKPVYYRDGTPELGQVEVDLAGLAGVNPETLMAYNTGMSAGTDSIDVALDAANTRSPVLACAYETYTQTKRYIENFIRNKRADVYYFDGGNPDHVAEVLEKRQPDVVVAESIGNFVNEPVLDIEHLLEQARQSKKRPVLVLDHTFPLSTGMPLGERLTGEDQIIVNESGTKSYILNGDMLGVAYTANEELFDRLRRLRRTRGSLPGPSHTAEIQRLLPESREVFNKRNCRIFKSTGDIAIQLAGAAPDGNIIVQHPAITSHANHELYERIYPDGGAPVLYISSATVDQYTLADRLWASDEVQAEASRLGQSFGFDYARIVADEDVGAVRIAGGSETDAKHFGEACIKALYID
jgi:cystathionine beta-lyase/cystathionine gamma-synthase